MQVQQGVHFDGAFVLAELGPRKQGETEVDGGRVQRIQALIKFHAHRIPGIQGPSHANQDLREIGVDAPVARLVSVS
jgi:hypothetical protein